MADKNTMLRLLARLGRMMEQQAYAEMEDIVSEFSLDLVVSDEFTDYCRWMKNPAAVIFVTTLAIHNTPSPHRPQMILQIYQSILAKKLSADLLRLPLRHVIRQTVAAIIDNKVVNVPTSKGGRFSGTGQEWFLATEICLDHNAMDSAFNLMQAELLRDRTKVFVLMCAKAFVQRAAIILADAVPNTPWKGWIRVQEVVYRILLQVHMDKVAHELAQLISEFQHKDGAYQQCIDWSSRPMPAGANRVVPLFRMAQAHCHLAAYDKAIALMDQALGLVIGQTDEDINAQFLNADVTGAKSAGMEFNALHAAAALTDLQVVLAGGGIIPFLVSGTLLGFQRNGGFLPHDKDIDVGIFAAQDIFAVIDLVNKSQCFRVSSGYLRIQETYQLPVVHKATGMCIDIFIYYPHAGKLVTGVHGTFGYTQTFAFTPFGLKTVRFLGMEFAVPDDIPRNLTENYGGWEISDPYYVTHLECPATIDKGGLVYLMVARLELFRAIIEGKYTKISRIADILRNYLAAPAAMPEDLITGIDARFGKGRFRASDVLAVELEPTNA